MLEELCRLWLQGDITASVIRDYVQDEMGKSALHFSHKLANNGTIEDRYALWVQSKKLIWAFDLLTTLGTKTTKLFLWTSYRNKMNAFHLPRKKGKGHIILAKTTAITFFIHTLNQQHKQT